MVNPAPSGEIIPVELNDHRVAKQKIYCNPREFAKAFGMS